MRLEATELIGDQVHAELTPLVFPCRDSKGEEVRMAAMACIPCLWDAVRSVLDKNADESRGYAKPRDIQRYCIYLLLLS